MCKITMLGAGSGFTERLLTDVMLSDGLQGGEFALVDIDRQRLNLARDAVQQINDKTGRRWTIRATTDRREVLPGSRYIVNCIEVSGLDTIRHDTDIPLKYGIKQCVGDTIGPGGVFKGLRTIPVWLDVLRDAAELCPDALVLNYTNPMSMMMLAASRVSEMRMVGLCHSVQGTSRQLADYAGVPYDRMKWQCAGINHMAWFTELSHQGKDLYPILRDKAIHDKETYEKDPVRFDMMLHFGAFVTESSGHFSEYLPYYRKRDDLIATYCREGFLGGTSFYADSWPKWRAECDENRRQQLAGQKEIELNRSEEYAAVIIQAVETGQPAVIHGNVPNNGLIDNLPPDGIVEVACLIDRNGTQPCRFGSLPPQMAALNRTNMSVYELGALAAIERSKELAIHAVMLDPLTAAVLCPREIRTMVEEMFDAEAPYLQDYR